MAEPARLTAEERRMGIQKDRTLDLITQSMDEGEKFDVVMNGASIIIHKLTDAPKYATEGVGIQHTRRLLDSLVVDRTPIETSPYSDLPFDKEVTLDSWKPAVLGETPQTEPGVVQNEHGAKRGNSHEDHPYWLIPKEALDAFSEATAEGVGKYGLHNWLKGFPISGLLTHAIAHIYNHISGDKTEDHLGHAFWNIGTAIYFVRRRPELNDMPPYEQYLSPQNKETSDHGEQKDDQQHDAAVGDATSGRSDQFFKGTGIRS